MIKSLLIANRGEIACRVIHTAKRMGIRAIAVYSQADENARHVRLADEAHYIGPAPATDSYLRTGRILSVAKEANADAIHPGYGFLSENADFAQLASDAGMVFVGPPPDAIRAMGLKDKAKEIMAEAGVPVVPGYHGRNQNPDFLKRKAYEIGYPVLIKAVAGGGGKGMRKVAKAIEFDDALDAAKREAQAAFGNDIVLIEKFVESPRHVEIQVFGDSKGNVVHLFERDCSLQRRHQKVIEEAPAPGMSEEVRSAMGKAACEAAKAVGYQGAGTVEFIVDGANGLREDGFYFMEMNTRLQVEHPVSEMISGVDLVEWQLRVASGEELPKTQEELSISGHAVEARIYAEDPSTGFLPSTGKLVALDLGAQSQSVRVDSGVDQGDEITPHYDPMIAKLIVHAADREQALDLLEQRLRSAKIAGPITNLAFLANLCASPAFRSGRFDTSLIDNNIDDLIASSGISDEAVSLGVCGLIEKERNRIRNENVSQASSPWQISDSFQSVGGRSVDYQFLCDGAEKIVRIKDQSGKISIKCDDDSWVEPSQRADCYADGEKLFVVENGQQAVFAPFVFQSAGENTAATSDGAILVPMHGKIIAVTVKDGDRVEQGDILFSVEAMKMEHAVIAPHDGTVSDVTVEVGAQMENGVPALKLTANETENV